MQREFFFPESLVPCLQHKNNLRVNKISLFLYLNRHVSLYKIHEKNSHKTVYIIIVRKCYLIKSYWYFISFHFISFFTLKYKTSSVACCGVAHVALISGSEKCNAKKTISTCQNRNSSEQIKSIA